LLELLAEVLSMIVGFVGFGGFARFGAEADE
jgi:hypothetical protein